MTQPDDTTFVGLDGSDAAITRVLDEIGALWLRHPWITIPDRMAFETALVELVTNVVRHSLRDEADTGRLRLIVGDTHLTAEITDCGPEFPGDLDHLPMPDADAESGRGLAVIRALADVFAYRRRTTLNTWVIVRRLTLPSETP